MERKEGGRDANDDREEIRANQEDEEDDDNEEKSDEEDNIKITSVMRE